MIVEIQLNTLDQHDRQALQRLFGALTPTTDTAPKVAVDPRQLEIHPAATAPAETAPEKPKRGRKPAEPQPPEPKPAEPKPEVAKPELTKPEPASEVKSVIGNPTAQPTLAAPSTEELRNAVVAYAKANGGMVKVIELLNSQYGVKQVKDLDGTKLIHFYATITKAAQ